MRAAPAPHDDPLFSIIGLGRDEATDVSERHDEYLVESEVGRWIGA